MSHPVKLVPDWGTKNFGPSLVKEAEEKVKVIRTNLKAAQMRQKSYHDKGKAFRETKLVKRCT